MNYFPFHVGDYAAHTSHLEPMEDLAYRRMLDLYYLREEPLPAEPAAVARLIRMRTNIADVETVLQEFFILGEQGWMHTRCDDEISRMREKLGAAEEKDLHEKDRMQRYRERRAAMFASLRECGIVPAWDIGMKDLQRLVDDACNVPATVPVTPPETPATHLQRVQAVSGDAHATAISTNTNTNTNTSIKGEGDAPDGPARPSMAGAICVAMKSVGMASVNPSHPELQVLIDSGADIGLFIDVATVAVKKQKPFAYVLATVKGKMRDAAALAQTALAAPQQHAETAYQRSMRERVAEISPELARPAPGQPAQDPTDYFRTIDVPALEIAR